MYRCETHGICAIRAVSCKSQKDVPSTPCPRRLARSWIQEHCVRRIEAPYAGGLTMDQGE